MIAAVMNGDLIYIIEQGAFFKWNGKIWVKRDNIEIDGDIAGICGCQAEQLNGREGFDDKRAIANGNVKSIHGIRKALAILLQAHSYEAFFSDKSMLCVRNGVIDFRIPEFELRSPAPHELYKHFHLTRMIDVDFIPGASAPIWDKFIYDITFGDADIAFYLQRVFGYALTGDPKEQKFFMLLGNGGNGKTVFLGALQSVLGQEYCCVSSPELFTGSSAADTNEPRPELLRLKGKRMVISSELQKNSVLSGAKIKRLVAGGKIYARGLYDNTIEEFWPEYSLFIDTNHLPLLEETGRSIRRRIGIIPFMHTFKEVELDTELDKKLNKCQEAILAWLVNGTAMYMQFGLSAPKISEQVIIGYIEGGQYQAVMQDSIELFVRDSVENDPEGKVSASDLYEAYQSYCLLHGHEVKSRDVFFKGLPDEMAKLRRHGRSGNYFAGVALRK